MLGTDGAQEEEVGRNSGQVQPFGGSIVYPRIYNRELSAGEIWNDFQQTRLRFTLWGRIYWRSRAIWDWLRWQGWDRWWDRKAHKEEQHETSDDSPG